MTAISLAFLLVCIFGAFAFGSATWMAVRQAAPIWGACKVPARRVLDGVSIVMFTTCTIWFALNAAAELRLLTAGAVPRSSRLDLAVFITAFAFPPLIMHVVFRETAADASERSAWWRRNGAW